MVKDTEGAAIGRARNGISGTRSHESVAKRHLPPIIGRWNVNCKQEMATHSRDY